MWEGFVGENNISWNEQEGTWKSSWLGPYWEINPTERAENGADDFSKSQIQCKNRAIFITNDIQCVLKRFLIYSVVQNK